MIFLSEERSFPKTISTFLLKIAVGRVGQAMKHIEPPWVDEILKGVFKQKRFKKLWSDFLSGHKNPTRFSTKKKLRSIRRAFFTG